MTQSEFNFKAVRIPRVRLECSAKMLNILMATGEWMTRRELEKQGMTPRECRYGRQQSSGEIIAGQRGYRATKFSSLDEIRLAAYTLRSQAIEMMREEKDLWKYLHGKVEK